VDRDKKSTCDVIGERLKMSDFEEEILSREMFNPFPKRIQFKEGNLYLYGQDMDFHLGIPADVVFGVEDFNDEKLKLTAPGYGLRPYGNGAIYLEKKLIQDLLQQQKSAAQHNEVVIIESSQKEYYSDTELLDWLQEQLSKAQYTGKVIFRWSSNGRGIRLHETTQFGAVSSIRQAIINAIQKENGQTPIICSRCRGTGCIHPEPDPACNDPCPNCNGTGLK